MTELLSNKAHEKEFPLKVAVTGASGLIGQSVVSACLEAGFEVLAIIRADCPNSWKGHAGLKVVKADLRYMQGLLDAIEDFKGCQVLVHLAADMTGEAEDQYKNTLSLTENIISIMDSAEIRNLVALSSIAVLDYPTMSPLGEISEDVGSNPRDSELGTYARMKRDQEYMYIARTENQKIDNPFRTILLRPGLVYNEAQLSSSHAGLMVGNKGLISLHSGQVPLIHVKSVASAVVQSIRRLFSGEAGNLNHAAPVHKVKDIDVFQLVNDDLPEQLEYLELLRKRGLRGPGLYMPWRLYAFLMASVRNILTLAGRGKTIPDALRKNSVAGRYSPFRFSNDKAKKTLGWQPASRDGEPLH